MTETEALRFAFDWPPVPFLLPRCCTCSAYVRRAKLADHMNAEHPGWLDTWNDALRKAGLR